MFKESPAIPCAVAAVLGAAGWGTAVADVPSPTVGGKIFTDFTNIDMDSDGTKSAASGTGFDVKRFYLIVNEKFDDIWSAKLQSDATYNSVTASTCTGTGAALKCTTSTTGQQVDVYMKNAWLQATLSKAFWVRLGESDMPWIPFDESVYNFRFVENTLIDRLHFGNSADWGLHIGGDIAGKMLSYQISAVNGAGYKNPTRSKDVDVEGRVSFQPITGVILAVGGYSGKLGNDKYDTPTVTVYHTANRFDALAAYVNTGLRVGVEYFAAHDWNDVTKATSDKANGTSVFASYDFTPMIGVFGRWDEAKLSQDVVPGLNDQYYNIGAVTHPVKNVDVALVYKHEKMDGGSSATATFSTTNGGFNELDGTYDEVGIWAQVAF
ncbi:MAG: porin [Steroidobacteraceae bacterium]